MPRRGGGLFACFGSRREQPEIRYEIDRDGHGILLQPVEVALPMPNESELNAMFLELVDELDLSAVHRKAMFDLPASKKWQIYCSRRKGQQESSMTTWPDFYADRLKSMITMYFPKDEDEIANRTKFLEELKTALRTQPMSFVLGFLELGGLQCLIDILAGMDWETCQSTIHTACIGCFKALMNNSHGRSQVLAHPTCINIIAQSLITENIKTKVAVLEILGACCLVPGGHKKVMDAMVHFQEYAEERTRFQTLLNDLDRSTGIYRDEFNLKIAIMSFVNAALRYGAGADHLEFRIHLRFEFLMLGLQPVMDKLRKLENVTLDRHLDFFDMVRNEDERELAKRYGMGHIDSKSASSMLDVLKQKIGHTTCYAHLLSILQHLLLLPTDQKRGATEYWKMIDRIIQEVTLQQQDGSDPDVAPVDLHVKYIVERMTMDDFKDDSVSQLAKREQEVNDLRGTTDKMADKLEKETKSLSEARKLIEELTAQLTDLQNKLNVESVSRYKLEEVVKEVGASIPDDAKIANLQSMGALQLLTPSSPTGLMSTIPGSLGVPGVSGIPGMSGLPPPPTGPVPPPPPPLFGVPGGPPPPPPPGPGGGIGDLINRRRNKLPKPSNPLKSFNWTKLPDVKIKGTLWSEMDDARVVQQLDFREIDQTFSAYQRKEQLQQQDEEDNKKQKEQPKELSFIDNRRAQNCQILLSKIKLSNQEIALSVMTMDHEENLSKDMLEQMLKFVPTADEKNLLNSHNKQLDLFAKSDRFLYEMGRIPHYEQRLKALVYKKAFNERMGELKPQFESVQRSCKQLTRSKRLRTLLELVLTLGNYMNRGARGNAQGFKLSSLNKIIDTKSSVDRKITLLHYILDLLERKFVDVFSLEDELPDVRTAAKISISDMQKEVDQLRNGLREVEKELEFQQKRKDRAANDNFVDVMTSFIKVANFSVQECDDSFREMKERFEKTVLLFGEDPKSTSLDEFFAIFNTFLISFAEVKGENAAIRKKKEEEEKKAKEMASQRERDRQRAAAKRLMNEDPRRTSISDKNPGEFDDLISALRTGDVFGEEINKFNKVRKRTKKASTPSSLDRIREREAKPAIKL